VTLPDLTGVTRDDAIDRLDSLGLRAEVQEEGDLLDELLGGDWTVCETQPAAGSDVRRGARIHVVVARGC
jgi:beta-lactam-binding protein with PASTA domain